ncbi:PHP domain-containing protein [Candidatus Nitrospira bockiana]
MTKHEIAQALKEIAFFLLLKGENPYKARAYQHAASALLACPEDLTTLVEQGGLPRVKGIGPSTASVIIELVRTGSSTLQREARGEYPPSLAELAELPGLSPSQIRRLYERARIGSLADLQAASAENRLLTIPGLWPKAHERIQAALGQYQRGRGYRLYADVLDEAHQLLAALERLPGVHGAALAGALRRKAEVVNDLHVVLMTAPAMRGTDLATQIAAIPNLTETRVVDHTVTTRSPLGLPVTIDWSPAEPYGLTLWLATGSPEHVDRVQEQFRDEGLADWHAVRARFGSAMKTEEAVYQAAGLPYIPPELREGRDELTWARTGRLPALIEPADIHGFFHTHTVYTDGANTLEEMVLAARARGYRYVGLSDHSQSAHYVSGLKEDRIRAQWAEIAAVQDRHPDIHLFRGIEADILPDGTMDYPDELLAQFDFVIASVHSRFNLSEDDQTRRICRALTNPYVTMLGHPTGRLLLSRAGYRVNLPQVLDVAARHGKMIEINGSRHRLDLDWRWAQLAKSRGIKLCVNPDAHAANEVVNVDLGVNVARKGGLCREDVANTSSLEEMKEALRSTRP